MGFWGFGTKNWIGFKKLDLDRDSEMKSAVSEAHWIWETYGVQFFGFTEKAWFKK
ncbi:MAG: hypothetical protein BroJett040_24940 [Oligoflexia bacterium]|nr:MAG: hypothetical protein BroJett040_24940 [Oligoflexia bacterium]